MSEEHRTTFVPPWYVWSIPLNAWMSGGAVMTDPWAYNTSEAARHAYLASVAWDAVVSREYDLKPYLRTNNVTSAECDTIRQMIPKFHAKWAVEAIKQYQKEITS